MVYMGNYYLYGKLLIHSVRSGRVQERAAAGECRDDQMRVRLRSLLLTKLN